MYTASKGARKNIEVAMQKPRVASFVLSNVSEGFDSSLTIRKEWKNFGVIINRENRKRAVGFSLGK